MRFFTKQNLFTLSVLILLSIPSILPLMHNGFFVTDDGEWMIIRLSAFYQAFADGQFPVRFLHRLNFDYGYPVATFLYPGIMYLGSIIHLFKIGFVDTIKIILALSMLGSSIFSYLWLRKFFDKISSLIGALFYVYTPYHLYDVYKRGSVGEVFAIAILPFIFWQIEKKSIFWPAIGISLLLLSHNSLALIFFPLIPLYLYFSLVCTSKNLRKSLLKTIIILASGIGVSGFFILPVLFEIHFTKFSVIDVSNPLEYFADISLIGWSTVLVILSSIFSYLKYKKDYAFKNITILFLITGIISIFLSSELSSFIWQVMPSSFIQFPFRILSVTLICVAFLSAFAISKLGNIYRLIFSTFIIFVLIISAIPFAAPKEYINKGEGFYATNDASTTVKNEYMPVWVKEIPTTRPTQKIEIINGQGKIENIIQDSSSLSFNSDLESKSTIRINTIYWPGWKVYINNKQTDISYNQRGVIEFISPKGISSIDLRFSETSLRLIGDVISIISFGAIMFLSLHFRKKSKIKK
ncbi:MAG TPA: hypothetical protein VM077_01880 [Candidatus Limnocylindrales bacterium]|nr:hypothetical protein [Candidatus Limnocylindrales bacterium]